MRTAIELLGELAPYGERNHDGFLECPHCNAYGWGLLDHDKGCALREARALLGKCPHGYTGGYDHGGGPCLCEFDEYSEGGLYPGMSDKDIEEVGYLVDPDEDLSGLGLDILKGLLSDGSEEIAARVESEINYAGLFDNPKATENLEWPTRSTHGKRIIRNAAQCRRCGGTVESKSVHDYVACTCGTIFVDGGHEYLRRGSEDFQALIELSEIEEW